MKLTVHPLHNGLHRQYTIFWLKYCIQVFNFCSLIYVKTNKMAYTTKDPCPPTVFSVPNRNKSWKCEIRRRRGRAR